MAWAGPTVTGELRATLWGHRQGILALGLPSPPCRLHYGEVDCEAAVLGPAACSDGRIKRLINCWGTRVAQPAKPAKQQTRWVAAQVTI